MFLVLVITCFFMNGLQCNDGVDKINCASCSCSHCAKPLSVTYDINQFDFTGGNFYTVFLKIHLYYKIIPDVIEHPPKTA